MFFMRFLPIQPLEERYAERDLQRKKGRTDRDQSFYHVQNTSINSFAEWVSEVTTPSCAHTMSSMRQPY